MIADRTVFVLGAAASLDFGFPLGAEFKTQIASLLDWEMDSLGNIRFDSETGRFFEWFRNDRQTALPAARRISKGVGFAASIDNYLEMHQADQDVLQCAKAAIGHLLQRQEQKCEILLEESLRKSNVSANSFDQSWHQVFAEICFQGCTQADLPEALSRFTVISFNYDRCFEQFIRIAISNLYNLNYIESDAICSEALNVIYPYGSLGPLSMKTGNSRREFGCAQACNPRRTAQNILTFSESARSENVTRTKDALSTAKLNVFLGFGYHRQNIELLQTESDVRYRQILGTAHKLSDRAKQITESRLRKSFWTNGPGPPDELKVELLNLKCREFMEEQRLLLVDG